MTPDTIFSIANSVALASWILIAAVPRRTWATGVVAGLVVPALFAVAYGAIILVRFAGSDGGFSSLPAVAALFADPWLLLAGWLHYLAFDLLVGSWEVRDAQARGISHLLVLPCLVLTFMFGPVGWLLYVGLTRARAPRFTVAT